MPRSLSNLVVVHFESRHGVELEGLIRRHGGVPRSAPAMSEAPIEIDDAEREVLRRLAAGNFDIVVLLTGLGTQRLLEEASRTGRLHETLVALSRTTTVARGPKPVNVLRRHGVRPTHVTPEPNTTAELLATLEQLPVEHQRVLVVSAGEPVAEPATSLRMRGAYTTELQLYRWTLSTSDALRLEDVIASIIRGEVGAALFTAQIHVRHLFDVATRLGHADELTTAFREHVLIGAVGPTSAQALVDRGIEPDVVPKHPKMGHLVVALAEHVTPPPFPDATSIASYVRALLDGVSLLSP